MRRIGPDRTGAKGARGAQASSSKGLQAKRWLTVSTR